MTIGYTDQRGSRRSLEADRVVCTVPFPVLRREIDVDRARLPSDKLRAIRNLKMVPAGRIALQMDTRFWQDEDIEGLHLAGTDTELERVFHSTNTQDGDSGILHAYLQGDNARTASGWSNKLKHVRNGLASYLPGCGAGVERTRVAKLWHDDPWAGGAWTSPKPDQFLDGFHVWGRREG